MKNIIISIVLGLILVSGSAFAQDTGKAKSQNEKDTLAISENDSTEYEITIIELGFDNWMLTNAKPRWYHTKEYYENKNQFFVSDWNNRVISSMHRPPFEYQIDYNPNTDYGLEVNYQLYWYFKFMEHKYGIHLHGAGKDR